MVGFGLLLHLNALETPSFSQTPGEPNKRPTPAIKRSEGDKRPGSIHGTLTFRGPVPKSPTPDNAGVRHDLVKVDRSSGAIRSVMAWLVVPPGKPVPKAAATPAARVDQLDHRFVPHVIGVQSGQPVTFSNSDAANHNVRTISPQSTNVFNVFTGMDGSYTHRFVCDPKQRPVRVVCDLHPWMLGWIYVLEHPYFAVTDEKGRFEIGDVPPGRYKLILRQPDLRYKSERDVLVSPGKVTRLEERIEPPRDKPIIRTEEGE